MIPACARTALARKLLVALWQLVTTGEIPFTASWLPNTSV
jgi:hypothetical protein